MNVSIYAQFAALIGETTDPISGKDTTLGSGIIPFGLSTKFGPARFNFEYRIMPSGRFEFGYWDRSYEIERATFSSTNIGDLVLKARAMASEGRESMERVMSPQTTDMTA